jgi:hypothetical protein
MVSNKKIGGTRVDPSEFASQEYEGGTGYEVGDRVRLRRTAFAPPGAEGIIVGVDVDLRDNDGGRPARDPCFRVLLGTGTIVYVTSSEIRHSDDSP